MRLVRGAALAIVASVVLAPALALAQCGTPGMSHGGHAGGHESSARKQKAPPKEIQAWLADEERREQLLNAVVSDVEFMRVMIERIVATPEWSALMRERLAAYLAPAAPESEERPAESPETEHQH